MSVPPVPGKAAPPRCARRCHLRPDPIAPGPAAGPAARAHRRGLFLLTAACIGPLTATLAYDFGFGPDTLSYVPIVFTLMLPIYAWLVLGEQIVEFTPLAYETVFQTMADPVVVVDEQGRKMSKSAGNVVDPQKEVGKYGADVMLGGDTHGGQLRLPQLPSLDAAPRSLTQIWA